LAGPDGSMKSHLQELKEQLVTDIERIHAQYMDVWGGKPEDIDITVPCSPDDLEEVQMLLEDLYPKSNYRAVAVEDGTYAADHVRSQQG